MRWSAFDKKKKKPRLKFNPGLALTGVRTTPCQKTTQTKFKIVARASKVFANAFQTLPTALPRYGNGATYM